MINFKKNYLLVLLLFQLVFKSNLYSQDITYMGSSYATILDKVKDLDKFYKSIWRSKKTKFTFKEKVDTGTTYQNKIFIEINFIWYTTPYRNFTYRYFFNDRGYCDSSIMYENACLDCGFTEDSSKLSYFGSGIWNRTSTNTFKSLNVFPIFLAEFKGKPIKCAYIKIERDPFPKNGICRIWTLTMEDELDIELNKRNLAYKDDKYLLNTVLKIEGAILGLFAIVGIISLL